ncbi:MAG: NUDIX domain-containing protein [Candidatus Nanoarchaeia archaeon]
MEKVILKQFLYSNKLKFNEIEKQTKIRSNKLAYHINNLCRKGMLKKEQEFYKLAENSEYLIPYLNEKQTVLPVILIRIQNQNNSNEVFLITRAKRPFHNLLGLPGGRILIGETIEQATQRIMKTKYKINCKLKKINSISLEHVKKKDEIIHSFLLITVNAKTNDVIKYTNIEKYKKRIITSDYKLIKNNINSEVKVPVINSRA